MLKENYSTHVLNITILVILLSLGLVKNSNTEQTNLEKQLGAFPLIHSEMAPKPCDYLTAEDPSNPYWNRYDPDYVFKKEDLKQFYTDGCSAGFPDGSKFWDLNQKSADANDWFHCCYIHDWGYFAGGTAEDRKKVDAAFGACIYEATKERFYHPILHHLMELGVRIGGTPSRHTYYRWGYGWPRNRGYKNLSTEELKWVKEEFRKFHGLTLDNKTGIPLRTIPLQKTRCYKEIKKFINDETTIDFICNQYVPKISN